MKTSLLFFISALAALTPADASRFQTSYSHTISGPTYSISTEPTWSTVLAATACGLIGGAIAAYALTREPHFERLFDDAANYCYKLDERYGHLAAYGEVGSYGFESAYKRFIVQNYAYEEYPFVAEALYLQKMVEGLMQHIKNLARARNTAQKRFDYLYYQSSIDASHERSYLRTILDKIDQLSITINAWIRFCERDLLELLVRMPEYKRDYDLKYNPWRYQTNPDYYDSVNVSISFKN